MNVESKTRNLIIKHIRRGKVYEEEDRKTFTRYIANFIDIDECMSEFCKTNRIPNNISEQFNTREFKDWLESIGWRR